MESERDRTVWCGNLSQDVTEEIIFELFLQAGPLQRVVIPKDKDGKKRSYAFITFKHKDSVNYAIELLEGTSLYNRYLNLQSRSPDLPLQPINHKRAYSCPPGVYCDQVQNLPRAFRAGYDSKYNQRNNLIPRNADVKKDLRSNNGERQDFSMVQGTKKKTRFDNSRGNLPVHNNSSAQKESAHHFSQERNRQLRNSSSSKTPNRVWQDLSYQQSYQYGPRSAEYNKKYFSFDQELKRTMEERLQQNRGQLMPVMHVFGSQQANFSNALQQPASFMPYTGNFKR